MLRTLTWVVAAVLVFVALWVARVYVFTSGFQAIDRLGR